MNLPVAYLIGLCVALFAYVQELVLPGAGKPWLAAAGMLLLSLPALLVITAARCRQRAGERDRTARWLQRAAVAALPTCYFVVAVPLGWLDVADRVAGDRATALAALSLGPLFVAEVARLIAESRAIAAHEGRAAVLRSRLALTVVFTMPWLLLGVAADLLSGHRPTYAFVLGTSSGMTLGAIAFVLVVSAGLPLVFRVLFGMRRDLPAAIAADVRQTAAALGFPGRAVLWLDSGMRHVNALLLGPLPWPRYLVLTDGLMTALEPQSLRGVVAHEVGHAQAGHPALLLALFVVAPLLVANAAQQYEPERFDPLVAVAIAVPLLTVAAWLLRRVAYRFEHEADVLSAIALGGADPCIGALQRVGKVVQQDPERAGLLHPSERDRVLVLRRFAEDHEFRARFALRGLHLRRAIAAALVGAALVAGWSWYRTWPYEQALLHFHTGDFAAAQRQVELVGGEVPGNRWRWWTTFREELDAAIAIAGEDGDWDEVRPRLASEGWAHGLAVLRSAGPTAARPWLALATVDADRSPLRRSLLRYCEAARDGDSERMEVILAHIESIGCPVEVRTAIGG